MADSLYKQAINAILLELEKDAESVMNECIQEITYTHRSYNLYDSYGYGIYLNGKLTKFGFLSATPKATEGKSWYGEKIKGRDAISDYLKKDYKPSGAIDLAIVAAMPYAKVLEDGSGNLKRSYRVISMSVQKLRTLAAKYNGVVKVIRK